MCLDCGCNEANKGKAGSHAHPHDHGHGPHTHEHDHDHEHSHDHGHAHDHDHAHSHDHPHEHNHDPAHDAPATVTRTVTLEQKILARNDAAADRNRQWLAERGVTAINFISSPGSGKTTLLERTLERLNGRIRAAVIAGDVQTDHDARRLAGKGAVVAQIETGGACHLDAETIGKHLPSVVTEGVRLLFIENVGNLVCPAAFDLGEAFKVALLSATEGEDKPVKYPTLFSQAPVALLTKMDLAPHLSWSVAKCREYLRKVRPGVFIFEVSAQTGQGMDAWIDYLAGLIVER
jgi:hydrogenase nickel incorporation protein HypB